MAKQLIFDETARRSLKKGIDRLADAIATVWAGRVAGNDPEYNVGSGGEGLPLPSTHFGWSRSDE